MKILLANTLIVITFLACQNRQTEAVKSIQANLADSIQQAAIQDSIAAKEEDAVVNERYKKYWGYRYHIRGDFDGDGKQETLTEKLISERTGEDVAKYCGFEDENNMDCYWTWRINGYRKPKALLQCSNPAIKDFRETSDWGTSRGFEFLQNTGDLNGDGTDEIMFIENLGGCNSMLCTGQLATYKNKQWKVVFEFSTRFEQYVSLGEIDIITPEDMNKPEAKAFDKRVREVPPVFEKKNGKVYYEEFEPHETVTKVLKINW
jgi:hypothetical protein